MCVCAVFFKHMTAYEMRISDWSSDVCSSDLSQYLPAKAAEGQPPDRMAYDQDGHHDQERSREPAMRPAAPAGINDAGQSHRAQHEGPDDCARRRVQPQGEIGRAHV